MNTQKYEYMSVQVYKDRGAWAYRGIGVRKY